MKLIFFICFFNILMKYSIKIKINALMIKLIQKIYFLSLNNILKLTKKLKAAHLYQMAAFNIFTIVN